MEPTAGIEQAAAGEEQAPPESVTGAGQAGTGDLPEGEWVSVAQGVGLTGVAERSVRRWVTDREVIASHVIRKGRMVVVIEKESLLRRAGVEQAEPVIEQAALAELRRQLEGARLAAKLHAKRASEERNRREQAESDLRQARLEVLKKEEAWHLQLEGIRELARVAQEQARDRQEEVKALKAAAGARRWWEFWK